MPVHGDMNIITVTLSVNTPVCPDPAAGVIISGELYIKESLYINETCNCINMYAGNLHLYAVLYTHTYTSEKYTHIAEYLCVYIYIYIYIYMYVYTHTDTHTHTHTYACKYIDKFLFASICVTSLILRHLFPPGASFM